MSAEGEARLKRWLERAYRIEPDAEGAVGVHFEEWYEVCRAEILSAAAEATQGERTAPKPMKTGWDGMSEQEVIATVREIRGEP